MPLFLPSCLQFSFPAPHQPASQRLRFDITPLTHPYPSPTRSPLASTHTHHTAAPSYSSPPAPVAPHYAPPPAPKLNAPRTLNPGSQPSAYPYSHARRSVGSLSAVTSLSFPYAGIEISQHREQQQHPHPHPHQRFQQLQQPPLQKHVWQYKSVPVGGLSGDGQQSEPQHPMQRQSGEAGGSHAQTQNRLPHEQQQNCSPPASQRSSTPLPWHAQYAPQQ